MMNSAVGSFDGKQLLNIETNEASVALKAFAGDADNANEEDDSSDKLLETEVNTVTEWMAGVLSEVASDVKAAAAGRMVSSLIDFMLKNDDFTLKHDDFLLNNDDLITKTQVSSPAMITNHDS